MERRVWFWIVFGTAILALIVYAGVAINRGFSTAAEPSTIEKFMARTARNLAMPKKARFEANPFEPTANVLKEARERFVARCAVCHAPDGSGQTEVGRNLYPKVPDLRLPLTQNLTDGQLRYIIRNGV